MSSSRRGARLKCASDWCFYFPFPGFVPPFPLNCPLLALLFHRRSTVCKPRRVQRTLWRLSSFDTSRTPPSVCSASSSRPCAPLNLRTPLIGSSIFRGFFHPFGSFFRLRYSWLFGVLFHPRFIVHASSVSLVDGTNTFAILEAQMALFQKIVSSRSLLEFGGSYWFEFFREKCNKWQCEIRDEEFSSFWCFTLLQYEFIMTLG